jgi:hypothetical protein
MISLKNYRGKRGIKSRGQRKEEKKKKKLLHQTMGWRGHREESNYALKAIVRLS